MQTKVRHFHENVTNDLLNAKFAFMKEASFFQCKQKYVTFTKTLLMTLWMHTFVGVEITYIVYNL